MNIAQASIQIKILDAMAGLSLAPVRPTFQPATAIAPNLCNDSSNILSFFPHWEIPRGQWV
jgi:hypothetical protein